MKRSPNKKNIRYGMVHLLLSFLLLPMAVATALEARDEQQAALKQLQALSDLADWEEGDTLQEEPVTAVALPTMLRDLAMADDLGIVIDCKTLKIRGVLHPYNASIIEYEDGFRIVFRADEGASRWLGWVSLDRNLEQTQAPYTRLLTQSPYSEDPRLLQVGDSFVLVYNDYAGGGTRRIRLATLDPKTYRITSMLQPEFNRRHVKRNIEKNWSPFWGYDEKGEGSLMFEYSISPRTILKLKDTNDPQVQLYKTSNAKVELEAGWRPYWGWGTMRGGTPGRAIGEGKECLAFFHSYFREAGTDWYVMGAYTFENKPPFRVTGISPEPILFKGIFDGVTMRKDLRTLYPCGYAFDTLDGKNVVRVSCGSNDMAIKVVTMDLEKLLQSLVPAMRSVTNFE